MEKNLNKYFKMIVFAIILYWAINNMNIIGEAIGKFIDVIFPFILGGAIAFILNIPMTFFEKKLLKIKSKKSRKQKNRSFIRLVSIVLAIVVIALIIALIVKLIVPELIEIIKLLVANIPYYTGELNNLIENKVPDIKEMIANINFEQEGENLKKELTGAIPAILSSSVNFVTSFIGAITNLVIAIVFAIYILLGKEKMQEQLIKILNAYFKKEKADKIINFGSTAKRIFTNFFTVQCLEATILGSLCIIGMFILQIPYAIQIGVLIGVTALIPIVGAFIGMLVGAILIVSIEPIKVITFVVFVLILQQVEGNLIYPRVVGNSVGLPGIWVLVAVSVGGKLFGVVGMLIGVPIFSVIYTIINQDVDKKISQKTEL